MESVDGVAPFTPAADRCISVDPAVAPLLPAGGLPRGRVVGCTGPAALSLALGLVSSAVRNGSWLAVVGLPGVGVEAAIELGIPASRLVLVHADGGPRNWAERVAAAADGFELVLTRPPSGAERVVGKVRHRLQARGVVMLAVGSATPVVSCDLELQTVSAVWSGVGNGHGRLTRRRVMVRSGGRRAPRAVEHELWLPGEHGHLQAIAPHTSEASDGGSVAAADDAVGLLSRAG